VDRVEVGVEVEGVEEGVRKWKGGRGGEEVED
jgi:hypothetical protein